MSRIDTEQAEHPAAFFIGACGGIILLEAGMPRFRAIFIGLFRRVHRLSNEIVEGGDMSEIEGNIQRIIAEKGLIQRVVAERAGFTKGQFCDLLHGRRVLKAEHMPRIARALGVSLTELYGEK